MYALKLLSVFSLFMVVFLINGITCIEYDFNEVDCMKNVVNLRSNRMNNSACIPRDTFINIDHFRKNYDDVLIPNKVQVKRCDGGGCRNKVCFKKDSHNITIYVSLFEMRKVHKCYSFEIEEHKTCECACKVMPHHCTNVQKYNENGCICECKDMNEKRMCSIRKNMIWNESKCKCECSNNGSECSTGTKWNPNLCQCAQNSEVYSRSGKFDIIELQKYKK